MSYIRKYYTQEQTALVEEYKAQLNELQLKAMQIAQDHLKTSFDIVKTGGYVNWISVELTKAYCLNTYSKQDQKDIKAYLKAIQTTPKVYELMRSRMEPNDIRLTRDFMDWKVENLQ